LFVVRWDRTGHDEVRELVSDQNCALWRRSDPLDFSSSRMRPVRHHSSAPQRDSNRGRSGVIDIDHSAGAT
ncbi:hypothetical protein AiwAL_11890, partial [Acidiphilium sp. AL]|uniref:hypothetical protein n=1 Tax=Acidiphilium sp. AL TaxID=2871704 RepID=UPI0021CB493C